MPCSLVSWLALGSCSPLSLNICLQDFSETLYEYALLQRRSCLHLPGRWRHLVGTTSDPAQPGVLGATWVICCARTSLWSPLLRWGAPCCDQTSRLFSPSESGCSVGGLDPQGLKHEVGDQQTPQWSKYRVLTPKRLRAEVQGQGGGHP